MSAPPARVLALWSPDWPVTAAAQAAHVPPHRPVAVLASGRVLACSAVARSQGVRRGLRRREAQALCPDLVVLTPDPERDARAFEPVVLAVEELAPGVEIVRPGILVLPARGPVGWFGGELAAAEQLVDRVAAHTGVECQVGVADGLFAAVLAARRGTIVSAGDTPAFLAPLGVEELDREPDVDRSELVDLLRRLGLRSLGAFGELDAADVASRFGTDAVLCHRLARGLDPRPPTRRVPPEELAVELELDPPVDRVDAAAFAARGLAERLHTRLAGHGLSCTRLGVAARTVTGEELHRIWRCAEPLTPSGTVDRVRWQLDTWLTRGGSGAVSRLWLVPEETVAAGALQLGLWGEVGEADARAGRAMARVQALLGPEAVVTAVLVGGRDPVEQVAFVPWGDERPADAHPLAGGPALADVPFAGEELEVMGAGQLGRGAGWEPDVPASDAGRPGARSRAADPPSAGSWVVDPLAVDPPEVGAPTDASAAESAAPPRPLPPPAVDPRDSGEPQPAPAGWPDDVLRATGRTSAAAPPDGEPAPRTPPRREPPTRSAPAVRGRPAPRDPPPSWPGRLPAPSPAVVPPEPVPAEVGDAGGEPVRLALPDLLDGVPRRVAVDGGPAREVLGWAGPWPVQQRWWVPGADRAARLQVVLDDGTALLLLGRGGRWWATGLYD